MIKLVEIYNLILEGAFDAQGVADKAYERFHIPTDAPNLKAHAELQRQLSGKPVGIIKDTYIFMNPERLTYFGKNVKAIGDIRGNLYVAQKDGNFYHYDIGEIVGVPNHIQGLYCKYLRLGLTNKFIDVTDYGDYDDYSHIWDLIKFRTHQNHPNIHILYKP